MQQNVIIANYAGFCDGALAAVQKARAAIDASTTPVYCIGHIVHNPHVTATLTAAGLTLVASTGEVPPGATFVIRATGLPAPQIDHLKSIGSNLIDCTCGNVRKGIAALRRFTSEGRFTYIAADYGHPEALMLASLAPDFSVVIDSPPVTIADTPSALVTQTTFPRADFETIRDSIAARAHDFSVADTICPWTLKAQTAAACLAKRVDAMIIIGGRESSNTRRLVEVCTPHCPTFYFEHPGDITPDGLSSFPAIGITGGASTPRDHISDAARLIAPHCVHLQSEMSIP